MVAPVLVASVLIAGLAFVAPLAALLVMPRRLVGQDRGDGGESEKRCQDECDPA